MNCIKRLRLMSKQFAHQSKLNKAWKLLYCHLKFGMYLGSLSIYDDLDD